MSAGGDQFLKRLNSYAQFYNTFNNDDKLDNCSGNGTTSEQLGGKLRGKLNGYLALSGSEETKKIMHAYCSACGKYELGNSGNDTPCYFFYFWVGDTYGNALNGKPLSDLLGKIYDTLQGAHYKKKCEVKYGDVDRTVLKNRKTVFDYYYNYKTEGKKLLNAESNCSHDWVSYRVKVHEACEAVEQDCKTGTGKNSQYCNDFTDKYGAYCDIANLLQQTCTQKSQLEQEEKKNKTCSSEKSDLQAQLTNKSALLGAAEASSSTAEENLRKAKAQLTEATKATATASISSIIGTFGITAIPFLLYKYKPWSSWFGNHTFGNGRRKSTRSRRSAGHELDTLTENSSTFDSTDTSTIGPAENSTVRSVAYTRPSTTSNGRAAGTNTNNNSTPGHRNNIGYQNM